MIKSLLLTAASAVNLKEYNAPVHYTGDDPELAEMFAWQNMEADGWEFEVDQFTLGSFWAQEFMDYLCRPGPYAFADLPQFSTERLGAEDVEACKQWIEGEYEWFRMVHDDYKCVNAYTKNKDGTFSSFELCLEEWL